MNRTIRDFGEQWQRYRDNDGFYGSLQLFEDIVHPFLKVDQIEDRRVAEIGSGTGRIVNMLLQAGASHVIATEPSEAFEVLCKNVEQPEKVTCLRITGDRLPADGQLDYVLSIGVLHHIPDPKPVVEAAYRTLRPGGKFLIWVYGKEGNRFYLALCHVLRSVTRHMPHFALAALVRMIYYPIMGYCHLCHLVPLPLRQYLLNIFEKMEPENRRLIVYDQLNPAYAKYYTRSEAEELLSQGKFVDIRVHHRHGYSWTLIGTKPQA